MHLKQLLHIAAYAFITLSVNAQDSLSLRSLLLQVRGEHPLENTADITAYLAELEVLQARAAFDPKLSFNHASKDYNGAEYYNLTNAEIKIPTWYGIELKAGYELNNGQYLNPERDVPLEGLSYAEISVPLLQNVLIDERRAGLSRSFNDAIIGRLERQMLRNTLYYDISIAYWNWYELYQARLLYSQAVTVANTRLQGIKRSAELGDYATIDTVEAYMELSRRQALLQEIQGLERQAYYHLRSHIWTSEESPLQNLQPTFKPLLTADSVAQIVDTFSVTRHPYLAKMQSKRNNMEINRKLYQQWFLPDVRVNYKPLVAGTDISTLSQENYTWGASIQIPVLYRKERAKLQMNTAKIEQIDFEMDFQQTMIQNEITALRDNLDNLEQMLIYQQNLVSSAQQMLQAEQRRLQLGDASIFIINYRERYLLDSQMKLIKTQKEVGKAQAKLLYKLGFDLMELLQ